MNLREPPVAYMHALRYRVAVRALLPLVFLAGCFGLDQAPERQKDEGHDLDSGIPWDSADPLDSAGDLNHAPTADAGDDADAAVGIVVSLDGSASWDPDGDPLAYGWRLVTQPSSSSASLVDEDRSDPQFLPDVEGRYVLGLVVSDGALDSSEDTVEVTATVQNGGPVANAGSDQTVVVGDSVNLNGSSSSDPDGDPLQFAWTLVTRPSGSSAVLSSTTSATPRFLADAAGTYEISLTVTDGADVSAPDNVRVTASSDGGDTSSGCGCRSTGAPDLTLGLLAALALWAGAGKRSDTE